MSSTMTIIGYTTWMVFTVAELELPKEFQSVLEQRDTIEFLSARFKQESIAPEELIESEGSLVYINPKRILFRYDDPPITYMIDAERSYEYDEEMEQLLVYDLEGGPEAEAFFLGFENNTSRVMEAYSISVVALDDPEKHAFTVVLTPKTDDEDEMLFQKAYLNIEKGSSIPNEIIIINDEENRVVFHLDQFKVNIPLPSELIQLKVPEGTEIIINDESVGQAGADGRTYPEPKPDRGEDTITTNGSALVRSESLEKVSNP